MEERSLEGSISEELEEAHPHEAARPSQQQALEEALGEIKAEGAVGAKKDVEEKAEKAVDQPAKASSTEPGLAAGGSDQARPSEAQKLSESVSAKAPSGRHPEEDAPRSDQAKPSSQPEASRRPEPPEEAPGSRAKATEAKPQEARQSWWGRFTSFFVAEKRQKPGLQAEAPMQAEALNPEIRSEPEVISTKAPKLGDPGADEDPPVPLPPPAESPPHSDSAPAAELGSAASAGPEVFASSEPKMQASKPPEPSTSESAAAALPEPPPAPEESLPESLPPLIPIAEGTELADSGASGYRAPRQQSHKDPARAAPTAPTRQVAVQDRAALPRAALPAKPEPAAVLPGLQDFDSIISQLAAGDVPSSASLILARSYMELQAGQHPTLAPFKVPPLPAPKEPPPVVAKLPIQEATQPPSQQPRAPEPSLEELFRGRPRHLRDQERQELWSRGLQFDLALVFPNPDYVDSPGLGALWQRCFCFLFGAWQATDLTKARRGRNLQQARDVFHDCFRGGNMDVTESMLEAAFTEAFQEIRPLAQSKGKKSRSGGAAQGATSAPESPRKARQMDESRPRPMGHGGTFRRVDVDQLAKGSVVDDDCEMGLASYTGGADVLYQHTLDPTLSGSSDFLSLMRNMLVATLTRAGLIVEQVFSVDFRWIYALVSASEVSLEELAFRHGYPVAVDLACVDPEAAEPCDRNFKQLADVYAKQGCIEVLELLCALGGQAKSKALAVQDGRPKQTASSDEEAMKEAFMWYLRSRVKGRSAWVAQQEANDAFPEVGQEPGQALQNSWDRLLRRAGPQAVRVTDQLGTRVTASSARILRSCPVTRLNGQMALSHFSREDRMLLIMASLGEVCDVFKLMRDGYMVDLLPGRMGTDSQLDASEESLGQASSLHLGWRRHMSTWAMAPALFGIVAQALSIYLPEWLAEIWLGYAILVSAWCSVAISAWRLERSRLLLSRGEVAGPLEETEDFWSWNILRHVRPAEPVPPHASADRSMPGMEAFRAPVRTKLLSCARMTAIRLLCLLLAAGSVALAVGICDFLLLRHDHFKFTTLRYNFAQDIIGLITAAEIIILNGILKRASLVLTRLEKHRSRVEFVRAHYLKALCLQFVNSYASLFYIAFYPDRWRLPLAVRYSCTYYADSWWNQWGRTCTMARLNKQLTAILIGLCIKAALGQLALRLLNRRAVKTAADKTRRELSDVARTSGVRLLAHLDEIMATPRWGDPEADFNIAGFGCFGRASEQVLVFGLLLQFAIISPWSGLLAFIFLNFCFWADRHLPGRENLPWRAGMPPCREVDFAAAGDWLLFTACRAISWFAVPVFAALLIWPAQLGSGWLSGALLGRDGSWQGSNLAPFGLYSVLLVLARYFPGLAVRYAPAASRLRIAEARLCRAMLKARHDLRGVATARSSRPLRGPPGSDFRVRTPHQWEQLNSKFSCY